MCLTGSRQIKGGHKTVGPSVSSCQATESQLFLTLYADDAPLDLYIACGVHKSWDGWMILMDMEVFRLVSNVSRWSMKAGGQRTNHQVWRHVSNLNTSTTKN